MTYEEIIAEEKAVVRFTAGWCGPCKALAPIFDEVAKENPDMKTYVVDLDKHPDIAEKFVVKGIPACFRVELGKVKAQTVGTQPKEEIEKLFK